VAVALSNAAIGRTCGHRHQRYVGASQVYVRKNRRQLFMAYVVQRGRQAVAGNIASTPITVPVLPMTSTTRELPERLAPCFIVAISPCARICCLPDAAFLPFPATLPPFGKPRSFRRQSLLLKAHHVMRGVRWREMVRRGSDRRRKRVPYCTHERYIRA